MKRNRIIARGKWCSMLLTCTSALLLSSCARDGYDDGERFLSSVTGQTLEAPDANGIVITPSADGKSQTVSWQVVHGAGGYKVSLFDASDMAAPIVADSIIDGCTVKLDRKEDTNYILAIQAMANAQAKNEESAVTQKTFTTFIPSYMEIPEGDLKEWFSQNPCPADSVGKTLVYDLVPDGKYTLSGVLDFGANSVQLRSTGKNKPAHVVVNAEANFKTFAGLTLKNMNFDCAATNDFIVLSKTPDESIKVESGEYYIKDPISIISCQITGITKRLVYDSDVKYALDQLIFDHSVIQIDHKDVTISFKKSIPIHMTFQNSTVYSTSKTDKFFMQIHGQEPKKVTPYKGLSGNFNFRNSTFYGLAYNKQFINTNTLKGRASLEVNIEQSIFVDCGKGEILNRLMNASNPSTFSQNTYWYNGAAAKEKFDTDVLATDPALANPDQGDFTVSGADQLSAKTGDPRWLPSTK